MTEYKIVKTVELSGMPNSALAKDLLERLRLATAKVVENRRWRVPVLKEFYPKNRSLLGLNVNRGKSIMIRLREGDDQLTFLPWESVLGTLVHELTHNEVGEHSAEFYKMMEKVYDEVDATSSNVGSLWGPRTVPPKYLFDGKSAKVGGGSLAKSTRIPDDNVRRLAVEAAIRRLGQTGDNVVMLGGGGIGSAKSRKELFLEAEERRRATEALGGQGCSVVKASAPSDGTGSGQVITGELEGQLRQDLGPAEWKWVCQVCTEENTAQGPVSASQTASSGSSSSSSSTKEVANSRFEQAATLCAWCGCTYGSSLLGGDGGGYGGCWDGAAARNDSANGEDFCIDCDPPVSRREKIVSGAKAAEFVDLTAVTAVRATAEVEEVEVCQWTRMAALMCPCCVPAPAEVRTKRAKRKTPGSAAADVIVLD